jgi:hypothetical protein
LPALRAYQRRCAQLPRLTLVGGGTYPPTPSRASILGRLCAKFLGLSPPKPRLTPRPRVFGFARNRCSASFGIPVRVPSESLFGFRRNLHPHAPRESSLGCPADSRRASHARHPGQRVDGVELPRRPNPRPSEPRLADVAKESSSRNDRRRLRDRPDDPIQAAVRVRGSRSGEVRNPTARSHGTSDRSMDGCAGGPSPRPSQRRRHRFDPRSRTTASSIRPRSFGRGLWEGQRGSGRSAVTSDRDRRRRDCSHEASPRLP